MKEDNRKTKKTIPLKIEEVLEVQTLFCKNASKTSEKARKR
jgi:hypothetical protein